jgi:hypothetical protein
MTATRCIAACNELGYGWAGLQNRERPYIQTWCLERADNQNVDVRNRTQGRILPLLPRSTIVRSHVMETPTRDAVDGDMSIYTTRQSATHHRPMELTTVYPLFQAIRVSQPQRLSRGTTDGKAVLMVPSLWLLTNGGAQP